MSIRFIAHSITKKQRGEGTLTLRDSLIAHSPELESLVQNLRNAITDKNPTAGKFAIPGNAKPPFRQRIESYFENVGDADFVAFSKDTARLLLTEMAKEPLSTGGYVVFAEHRHGAESFVIVAIITVQARPTFDEDLNLISALTLDLDHLRHAARIRVNGVLQNDEGCIHAVSRQSHGASNYFVEFLGFEAGVNPAVQGRKLHSALSEWAETKEMDSAQKDDLLQKTHTYWKQCKHERQNMSLTTLANVLSPADPRPILAFLGDESRGLAGEFPPPPPNAMKQYLKFTYNGSNLKLEFDRNAWLDNVTVNMQKTVTIKNAPQDLVDLINDEKNAT